ncbi:two component transcriptional regulator, LuxR family [Georgenia satyanarayanai]|uniref:Two component transcriptional regulator, LuxR family n=1 Tax=Georgenia satyanarayanai TaxID=860221 RepID=A0A2Y9AYT3_9MICO|nr:response regulator transcription factor [Georgenia satyanarayanai]PYF95948.1 LuxR family two component transcriptional regulator [Georgenia satyanarayanai]SSA47269.1 two component transcriptional regulator, LuxR family [Georgenia satyanarayanai]
MAAVRVRVLVVDDDALVRSALVMMLDGAHDIAVVAEAADGAEVPAALDRHAVDVVLMDLRMPRVDGVTATARLRARPGAPEVLVLTTFDTDEEILGALRAGACGYLLKDTPPPRIAEAVRRAAAGEATLSPAVTRRLMEHAVDRADVAADARTRLAALTDRERDVVAAVGRGLTNAEIAAELYVSVATVKAQVSHVLATLDVGNRTQVALLAHEAGLV